MVLMAFIKDVEKDDNCILCIHDKVCIKKMSDLCVNYSCGMSDSREVHEGCVHRFPRYSNPPIACFKCRFFQENMEINDDLLRALWKRTGSEVALDSLIESMEELKESILSSRNDWHVTWSYAIFESLARVEVFLRMVQANLKDWDQTMDEARSKLPPEEQKNFGSHDRYRQVEQIRCRIYDRIRKTLKNGDTNEEN